jgi:hypothetical protein
VGTFEVIVAVGFLAKVCLVLKDYELNGGDSVEDGCEKKKFPIL